jgi:hypothetical protein
MKINVSWEFEIWFFKKNKQKKKKKKEKDVCNAYMDLAP